MTSKDIIIFGAGIEGEKFVYRYFGEINISCFWDNRKSGELLGYQIKKPSYGAEEFIVVASAAYLDIRDQLTHMGYCEFEDFIPVQIFQKKLAVAYGNCHMDAIRKYLESHRRFTAEYGFYPLPAIHIMQGMNLEYQNILQKCDLFLHQSVRKENVYGEQYASEHMLQYIKKSCVVISVPNLYGMPKYLFPQLDMRNQKSIGDFCPFFIDSNIAFWIESGMSKEKIKQKILEGGVYPKSDIINLWASFSMKLHGREKEWDIKISDYIFRNYKKEKLFNDINHITSGLAREIALRILTYMGYQDGIYRELPLLDELEIIVYRDVKEALGLEFEETNIRKYSKKCSLNNNEMDMDEYIEQLYRYTAIWLKYQKRC